uniref:Uncharacterized protein n=1 Tax=Pipistrellus kuhlii TaxID=59472 RepID=A0A7J7W3M3_PIPKU|nr:hypothetical protein mPipKuh1_008184 [Pipistrellus kuhlii]
MKGKCDSEMQHDWGLSPGTSLRKRVLALSLRARSQSSGGGNRHGSGSWLQTQRRNSLKGFFSLGSWTARNNALISSSCTQTFAPSALSQLRETWAWAYLLHSPGLSHAVSVRVPGASPIWNLSPSPGPR